MSNPNGPQQNPEHPPGQNPEPWGTFRAEMRSSARAELRDLGRSLVDGLIEALVLIGWFVLWIAVGALAAFAISGESGLVVGGVLGALFAGFTIVVFYVVMILGAGVVGIRGLLRRRRSRG